MFDFALWINSLPLTLEAYVPQCHFPFGIVDSFVSEFLELFSIVKGSGSKRILFKTMTSKILDKNMIMTIVFD